MSSVYEQNRQADARDAALQLATERLRRWLVSKGWTLNIAAMKLFQEEMGDDFLTATNEDFEYHLGRTDSTISLLPAPSPEQVKATLIEQICTLLKSPGGDGRGGRYTYCGSATKCLHKPSSICNIHAAQYAMQTWDIPRLTARLQEIRFKQEKHTVTELRQLIQSARPERRADGYPRLPTTIVPPGQVQAVTCDSAYLLGLAKTDFYEYKRLVSRYGSTQITERQKGVTQ